MTIQDCRRQIKIAIDKLNKMDLELLPPTLHLEV